MTLDELADLLRLPEGHSLHAVDELPAGYCPGVALTIVSDGDATGHLPKYKATEALLTMDLTTYRKWVGGTGSVRSRLRSGEESRRLVPRHDDHQDERQSRPGRRADDGYTPARLPIAQSPAESWPHFPGEGLPITGEAVRGDPGDEDQHLGGPR